MNFGDIEAAVQGSDAIVLSLGNSQSPVAMLFGAARTTPADICDVGTRNVIDAMSKSGARRLVVVSAFGVGETRSLPSLMAKFFFKVLLKEHMADKEKQEILVKASGLDCMLVQPVGGLPQGHQRILDNRPMAQMPLAQWPWLCRGPDGQYPNPVLAMPARDRAQLVENAPLLQTTGRSIAFSHLNRHAT